MLMALPSHAIIMLTLLLLVVVVLGYRCSVSIRVLENEKEELMEKLNEKSKTMDELRESIEIYESRIGRKDSIESKYEIIRRFVEILPSEEIEQNKNLSLISQVINQK